LYQALSSGALDGLEWVGPAADERAGFWEVAKVYYTAGFHEPGAALSANINLDKWNSLSEPHQAILRYASMATTLFQLSETLSANGAALQRMQSQGVKALQFPDEIWDAFGAASTEVLNEYMDDELFRTTRTSFDASLASSASWINKSDGYYVQQRVRVLG
jgi:TRAP-type mannitol/chloroaromatic compound transport system substrate-binding protein